MATIEHTAPLTVTPVVVAVAPRTAAPKMATRQDSIMTVDMHIPGAWNGTNPSTPMPITEDMKYFGQTLKTVPGTVQEHMPAKETVATTGSSILNKAAAIIPASVMNTATNVLPKSLQPTTSPTAADAVPPSHPSTSSNEHPIVTTTNTVAHSDLTPKGEHPPNESTLMGKAAAILPASVIGAAAAYLPASVTGQTAPTTSDAYAGLTTKTTDFSTGLDNTPAAGEKVSNEVAAGPTWTEKAATGLPAAAAAYIPAALSPKASSNEPATTAVPEPASKSGTTAIAPSGTLVGSSVSPDEDVQAALGKAANPHVYKSEIVPPTQSNPDKDIVTALNKAANPHEYKSQTVPPMHSIPSTAPSVPPKDDHGSLRSTDAVGGTTPMTLKSYQVEGDGYPEHNRKGVSGMAGMAAAGGVGAFAVDHGLRDQRQAAVKEYDGSSRPAEGTPKDSFMHVVIPATPGAGLHEQEMFEKKTTKTTGDGTLATHGTLKKKDRSGSVSAGEASPSSPSKSGMFSGIRKLTKKRDRSASKGHGRNASVGDAPALPVHGDSLDSNSADSSPTNAGEDKREKHVLHKDPPAAYSAHSNTTGKEEIAPFHGHADATGSTSNHNGDTTPGMLASSYSPSAPPTSPSKVGFREKVKGEFMVVQGSLTRDKGLKEAGEKMKKGTM